MAVTKADIDALTSAIGRGVRSATVGGQTVTYNTTASLIAARDALLADYNAATRRAAGVKRTRQTRLVYTGRGFN